MFETRIVPDLVDGVGDWVWPAEDFGLWEGPTLEWPLFKEAWLKVLPNREDRHVIVQAGGAAGMYPRLLSEFWDRVYTFEPDSLNFHCLTQNCQSDRIFKFNAGLGDKNGWFSLWHFAASNAGMHRVDYFAKDKPDNPIPMFAVDSFKFERVDALWFDTEGYESEILKGCVETIERFWPIIVCENSEDMVVEFMTEKGYAPVDSVGADTFWKKMF